MLSQHTTLIESFPRFWSKVALAGPDECWNWTASLGRDNYGRYWNNGELVYAHRFAYELCVTSIPHSLELDHLCRTRYCVNPNHLEPVTHQENVRRGLAGKVNNANLAKTHCLYGHPYDEANTYVRHDNHRFCRACNRARAKYRVKHRNEARVEVTITEVE